MLCPSVANGQKFLTFLFPTAKSLNLRPSLLLICASIGHLRLCGEPMPEE